MREGGWGVGGGGGGGGGGVEFGGEMRGSGGREAGDGGEWGGGLDYVCGDGFEGEKEILCGVSSHQEFGPWSMQLTDPSRHTPKKKERKKDKD